MSTAHPPAIVDVARPRGADPAVGVLPHVERNAIPDFRALVSFGELAPMEKHPSALELEKTKSAGVVPFDNHAVQRSISH